MFNGTQWIFDNHHKNFDCYGSVKCSIDGYIWTIYDKISIWFKQQFHKLKHWNIS